jgi:transposase-like protein
MIDFKGHRFEEDLILRCVRWYLGCLADSRKFAR